MAISDDAREWLEAQNQEFMHPYAYKFTRQQAREETGDEDARAGWYSRLSAPGYLDCTDWSGPYKSQDEAFTALYEMYGE